MHRDHKVGATNGPIDLQRPDADGEVILPWVASQILTAKFDEPSQQLRRGIAQLKEKHVGKRSAIAPVMHGFWHGLISWLAGLVFGRARSVRPINWWTVIAESLWKA